MHNISAVELAKLVRDVSAKAYGLDDGSPRLDYRQATLALGYNEDLADFMNLAMEWSNDMDSWSESVLAKDSMTAEQAYREDLARRPNYDDGSPRKSWQELGEVERSTWVKNPTPRDFKPA